MQDKQIKLFCKNLGLLYFKKKLKCEGINIVQNNGELAGQTVFHFHMHIIPRYKDDGQHIGWKQGKPTEDELERVRKMIID